MTFSFSSLWIVFLAVAEKSISLFSDSGNLRFFGLFSYLNLFSADPWCTFHDLSSDCREGTGNYQRYSPKRERAPGENHFNMADELKVGFIGGGTMARALVKGFITTNTVRASNIIASATTEKTLAVWKVRQFVLF